MPSSFHKAVYACHLANVGGCTTGVNLELQGAHPKATHGKKYASAKLDRPVSPQSPKQFSHEPSHLRSLPSATVTAMGRVWLAVCCTGGSSASFSSFECPIFSATWSPTS